MKVLITGSNGATATYMREFIESEHAECSVIPFVRGQFIEDVIGEHQPEFIFHLAGATRIADSFKGPAPFVRDNVTLTFALLEAVKRYAPTAHVLVASTCEVYGIPRSLPMREDHPINPVSPYAVTKAAADMAARMYAGMGLHVVVSRLFNVINPLAEHLFSSQWARQAVDAENNPHLVVRYGNLDSARTLLDVRDVVRGYWMLLERGQPGEAYNIGSSWQITLQDFMNILSDKCSRPIRFAHDPSLVRPVDIPTQVADIRKFLQATGWAPRYSLYESVEFLLSHYRNQYDIS